MHDRVEARLASLRAEMREIAARLGTPAEHPDDMDAALRLGHEATNMLQIRQLCADLRATTAEASG